VPPAEPAVVPVALAPAAPALAPPPAVTAIPPSDVGLEALTDLPVAPDVPEPWQGED
jgi:hypothetical protein